MGSRSRKRDRPRPAVTARPPATPATTADRAAARAPDRAAAPADRAAAPPSARAAKTEAKNAAVRATLEPLARGERPPWVTYAAVFAALLGVLNVGLYVAGERVAGSTFAGTVGVGVVLLVCAIGMWRTWYGAILGFEVLLGVTTVFAGLSLLVASSVTGAVRSLLVFAVAGLFFYKLIRAMARVQMPQRAR